MPACRLQRVERAVLLDDERQKTAAVVLMSCRRYASIGFVVDLYDSARPDWQADADAVCSQAVRPYVCPSVRLSVLPNL